MTFLKYRTELIHMMYSVQLGYNEASGGKGNPSRAEQSVRLKPRGLRVILPMHPYLQSDFLVTKIM